jgi:hypothetical protein
MFGLLFSIGIIIGAGFVIAALIMDARTNRAIAKEFMEIHEDPDWKPCPISMQDKNGQCTCLVHQEVCIPYARKHKHDAYGDTCLCVPQCDYNYYYRALQNLKNAPFWDWRQL